MQLNAFEPAIAYNLLTMLMLLSRAATSLSALCVLGIRASPAARKAHLDRSTA